MRNLVLLFFSCIAFTTSAQISFMTGSVQLDSDLNAINTSATANFTAFKGDMALSFGVSKNKLDYMSGRLNMVPGEIYLALEISRLSRVSIDRVITVYTDNKNRGWGYIAKELGIKPGSSEFHQLKNNASSNKKNGRNNNRGNSKAKGKAKKH